jgi:hypothetical protein
VIISRLHVTQTVSDGAETGTFQIRLLPRNRTLLIKQDITDKQEVTSRIHVWDKENGLEMPRYG